MSTLPSSHNATNARYESASLAATEADSAAALDAERERLEAGVRDSKRALDQDRHSMDEARQRMQQAVIAAERSGHQMSAEARRGDK